MRQICEQHKGKKRCVEMSHDDVIRLDIFRGNPEGEKRSQKTLFPSFSLFFLSADCMQSKQHSNKNIFQRVNFSAKRPLSHFVEH